MLRLITALAALSGCSASFTATFDEATSFVLGSIVFDDAPGGGYTVTVDLQHPDSIQVSSGHKWHIHTDAPCVPLALGVPARAVSLALARALLNRLPAFRLSHRAVPQRRDGQLRDRWRPLGPDRPGRRGVYL